MISENWPIIKAPAQLTTKSPAVYKTTQEYY